VKLTRVLAIVAGALLVGATGTGQATSVARAPLRVSAASLTQDGQQLVWHVELGHSFSAAGLKHDRRSLCMLIERPANASVSGVLCVAPSPDRRHTELVYRHVTTRGRGPGQVIRATVTRSGAKDLTARFGPASIGNSYASIRWQVLSTLGAPACKPKTPNQLGCTQVFPAKPALARLHTPQVVGCIPSGAPYVFNGSPSRHVIALTFDDGPWPDTPQFLDILEREHVHATFFQIGEQVSTYGAAVDRRMLADGDMIGDHTWSHVNVSGAGTLAAAQISQAAAAIRGITGGFTPCLFRAPGGAVSGALIAQARSMGFTTIEWNIDPRDWARPGTAAIYSNVVGNARNGAIVIQHDGGGDRSETIAALPHEIATLRSEGYQFDTITQLLGQRLVYR
jgi:peptidoglycan/xylan/chitin deacetylase (PgdA/CDA1 family)